jgi:6-phosphogluconate dehydrogenase
MVHNGIEYGDMQLICEAYHLMKVKRQRNSLAKTTFRIGFNIFRMLCIWVTWR